MGLYDRQFCRGEHMEILSNQVVALARVPVRDVTNISKYEYLVNGTWKTEQPGIIATNIKISNVSADGQGTYFFSQY